MTRYLHPAHGGSANPEPNGFSGYGLRLRPGATNNSPYQLPPKYRGTGGGLASRGGLGSIFSSIFKPGQLDLGTLDTGESPAVNTAQVDGSSDFLNKLSGFGEALLGSIGGKPETQSGVTPVAFTQGGGGGVDLKMVAMVGLAGAVVYYATKS
jgi:hypothetical protein